MKIPKASHDEGHRPTVKVPWARKNSGFTLLFEAWIMELANHLYVSVVAKLVGVRDKRLWRYIKRYVDVAENSMTIWRLTASSWMKPVKGVTTTSQ